MNKKFDKFYRFLYKDLCKLIKKHELNIDSIYIDAEETIIIENTIEDASVLFKVSHYFNNRILDKELENVEIRT